MLAEQLLHVHAPPLNEAQHVLTPEALSFIARLEAEFGSKRRKQLERRAERQLALDAGQMPDFLPATVWIRNDADWTVASIPDDLQDRRVEITGPTDKKMLINALNSGANVFMADFEDANSPTWRNMIQGQANLKQAIEGTLSFTSPEGKRYQLNRQVATLMVRPRGLHLEERHITFEGKPFSASLFDFGLYFFHNARALLEKGSGPYFYLPKLESHLGARLWSEVFDYAEDEFNLPRGTIKCTVLIETILAAFEMEEILYELQEHIVGLNAGRWDYIFSVIKKFRNHEEVLLPDRAQITMTVPFMRAYTELLVKTCHRRGAHAIGGMAAFIPSRKDPNVNEIALAKVREDKQREADDGFDGTWVAHPDLVPVAREIFDRKLGEHPHQKQRPRDEVNISARDLLKFDVPGGQITQEGLRTNITVALQYLQAWLGGSGAVAINNLMEDTATAEISRAQIWQWLHHRRAAFGDGQPITVDLYRQMLHEEHARLAQSLGDDPASQQRLKVAAALFDHLATSEEIPEFLTTVAAAKLPD